MPALVISIVTHMPFPIDHIFSNQATALSSRDSAASKTRKQISSNFSSEGSAVGNAGTPPKKADASQADKPLISDDKV